MVQTQMRFAAYNAAKCDCGRGSAPDPTGETYHRGTTPRLSQIPSSTSSPLPSPLLFFPSHFLFFLVPLPPFRSRSLHTVRGSGDRCKLPSEVWGRSPTGKRIWCHMVSSILLIFLRMDRYTGQLLVGPNALWPTEPKFWVVHGPPAAPPYSL